MRSLKNILLLRTMFSRLLASFLAIIVIISSFYLYSYRIYLGLIENEITNNIDERFDNIVKVYDRYIEQIKSTFVLLPNKEAFFPVRSGLPINSYDQKRIYDEFKESMYERNQNEYINYLKAVFIMTNTSDGIINESRGTYTESNFFTVFFNCPEYNEEFWRNELKKDFTFKIYPSRMYYNNSIISPEKRLLTPIAYKMANNSNFAIIALIDTNAVFNDIQKSSVQSMIIYNNEGELIFPQETNINVKNTEFMDSSRFAKVSEGYLFMKKSTGSGLVYYRLISDAQLQEQLGKVSMMFKFILIFAVLVSALIAALMAAKFNNPVKQIAEAIRKNKNPYEKDKEAINLDYIKVNVQQLVSENASYIKDIDTKNSMLQEFFMQSRMKDVYFYLEDMKSHLSVSSSYMLLHFKVHYRESFYEEIFEESGKATFFFKELIDLYLAQSFADKVTFQVENDQLVSIINVGKETEDISAALEIVKQKLKSEETYAFFTIVVSKVYDDISALKKVYNKLFEISRHRKLIEETQILYESRFENNSNRFYFSLEQMEKFASMMQNGALEKSLQFFDCILEYNVKKDVSSFSIYLLCIEVMNCSVKLLNKLFYDTSAGIDVSEAYSQLDRCSTLAEYRKTCQTYIRKTVEYIKENKRESDYIIDFITDYIQKHYAEDIYLDLFAEKLNLTSAYISAYFKDKLGINLTDYINSYRVKKAISLIENSQTKVKDIAVMVGITNINTFIRLFKKYAGYTPNEYRKKANGVNY